MLVDVQSGHRSTILMNWTRLANRLAFSNVWLQHFTKPMVFSLQNAQQTKCNSLIQKSPCRTSQPTNWSKAQRTVFGKSLNQLLPKKKKMSQNWMSRHFPEWGSCLWVTRKSGNKVIHRTKKYSKNLAAPILVSCIGERRN